VTPTNPGTGRRWALSLRWRLLAATLVALLVALVLAGLLLAGLFKDHVHRQFATALTVQLDELTARLEFDAAGTPQLDAGSLSDPRWRRPYSGLYWQLDAWAGEAKSGVLRSRSLWDTTLAAPRDALPDGRVHQHEIAGPGDTKLLLLERTLRRGGSTSPWRLLVAADLQATDAAVQRFNGMLALSLGGLLLLLCAAAAAQLAVGLAPLRALQRAVGAVQAGESPRLEGRFPAEVQPLIDDFNGVLDRNAEIVARARTQAGNLAHAIKTPLAAMSQAAATARRQPDTAADLAMLVQEQVVVAQRHVDWHLARARAAAAHGLPGAHAPLAPVVEGLVRVMARVHAERGLGLYCTAIAPGLAFAGEAQDLQEMLGNLLDNACKWARHEVTLRAEALPKARHPRLRIVIEDDGPGIDPARRDAVLIRGARLDESVPGSGLGLAIVRELAGLYGGTLAIASSAAGGVSVTLELPAADAR
jgi:signal transduction histidine kinase